MYLMQYHGSVGVYQGSLSTLLNISVVKILPNVQVMFFLIWQPMLNEVTIELIGKVRNKIVLDLGDLFVPKDLNHLIIMYCPCIGKP